MNANTIRGTVTDTAKGQNLTRVGFHWGTGSFTKNCSHAEEPLLLCEKPPIEHMTLLLLTAGIYSLESFLTTDSNSKCFFFSFFFSCQPVLPASHLKLSKSLLLLLVSPPLPLPTSALKGSLQLEGKQTQQWIFN